METQNTEGMGYFPETETTTERSLSSRSTPPEKLNKGVSGWPAVQRQLGSDEFTAVTRAERKRCTYHGLPLKTRSSTRKRTTLNPSAVDEDGAVDSPPSVDISPLFLMSPYPITVATHGSIGWAVATLAIIVFLTAMLMVAIAISV